MDGIDWDLTKSLECINNVLALPSRLLVIHQVLPLAATTYAKVWAWWCTAIRRRTQHVDHLCLLEPLLRSGNASTNTFARQRTRNEMYQSIESANGNSFEPDGVNVNLDFLLWSLITHASLRGMFDVQR